MGTTAQKLEYLNGTKTAIKNAINQEGEVVTSSTTFRNYATGINTLVDTLKSYIPHTAVSGNPVSVNNAIPLKPKLLEVDGDSKQHSTTGKNKWNNAQVTNFSDFIVANPTGFKLLKTTNGRSTLTYTLNLSANTTYTISCNFFNSSRRGTLYCQWKAEDTTTIWSPSINGATTLFTPEKNIIGVIFYLQADEDDGAYIEVTNFQIEEGSTATLYEPYTNGPSPNPEYPQPINTVKSSNGTLNLGKMGKNLININERISTEAITYVLGEITNFKTNQEFVLSSIIDLGNTEKSGRLRLKVEYNDLTPTAYFGNWIIGTGIKNTSTYFIVTSNVKKLFIEFQCNNIGMRVYNIQLEEGTTATPYEPYKHDTIPFNIGNTEFASLPNGVKDKLWVNLRTGQYGKTGNVRYLSAPIIDMNAGNEYPGWKELTQLALDLPNYNQANFPVSFLCNVTNDATFIGLNTTYASKRLILNKNKFNLTEDQWKANYPDLIFKFYYQLLTPESITLGTLSQENLAKLVMYAGVNNIELSGYDDNGAEPIIELDYYTEVQ